MASPTSGNSPTQGEKTPEDTRSSSSITLTNNGNSNSYGTWSHSEGGYNYELLDVTDSRYECPICLLCLKDPVLTTCGHRFCSGCIRYWVVSLGGKCPVDAETLSAENIFPDNFTRREIMQSKAICPYKSEGCVIVLPIIDLERHIHTEHKTEKTNGAHFSGGVDGVGCLFKDIGCDMRVHPTEMQWHLDSHVHHHLQLMTTAYKRLKKYSSSRSNLDHPGDHPFWRQDSRDSQRWLLEDSLESDDYEFRRQRSWDSVRFAQNKNNAKARPRFLQARLAESDESLCKPHNAHGPHCDPQTGEPSKSAASTSGTSDPGAHQLSDLFERLVRLEQNDREKQIKIDKLQNELASAVNLFSAATNIVKDLTARYCHGVFVWTIPDFRKVCTDMRKDPNRVRNSPGFYTDTFGYKLCLRFNITTPSSHGAAVQPVDVPLERDKETFISLYVHFMKGEFDETLPWPFQGEMSLLIIHPSNPELSIVEDIVANRGAAYGKPNLPRNPTGIGFREFCPIDKAFLDGFVKNDVLICKIHAKAHYMENKT